jgi:hypothetical protein
MLICLAFKSYCNYIQLFYDCVTYSLYYVYYDSFQRLLEHFVLICDSFYIQWFVNVFPNLYLDPLEFEINWLIDWCSFLCAKHRMISGVISQPCERNKQDTTMHQKNTDVTWKLGAEMKEFVCGNKCGLLYWKYITCTVLNVHATEYIYGWFNEKINKTNITNLVFVWQPLYTVNDKYMVLADVGDKLVKVSTKHVRQESKCSGLRDSIALTWGMEARHLCHFHWHLSQT